MQTIVSLLILLAVLLSGCAVPSTPMSSPTQTLEATASSTSTPIPPTATATVLPTPTRLPNAIPTDELGTSLFHFYEGNPVLQQSNNPGWDNVYIDPGAMLYRDGQFHMFFNGINGFPAPVGVGYATSPDGYQWTRQVTEPVLSAKSLSSLGSRFGNNFFVTSALVEDDGTWVLYFYTLRGNTFSGAGIIGRATAPAPTGPWTIDPAPVLTGGSKGTWDEVQVTAPDVHKTDSGYIMYYDGHGDGTESMIGMATSPDGITWTKYNDPATNDPALVESDPVLTVSSSGWDATRVIDPNVIQTADGWKMVYMATDGSGKFTAGGFAFGVATSQDGIHWVKNDQNPVLSNKEHPNWSATYLSTLLYVNNIYYLYFDFVSRDTNGTNVYLATFDGSLK